MIYRKADTNIYDKKLKVISKRIRNAFFTVKEELNEHLESINENTDEIQSNFEYLYELDSKINKLGEKVEYIQLIIEDLLERPKPKVPKVILTTDEQKVFILLYTSGENDLLSYENIFQRLNIPEVVVTSCMKKLIEKQIPVIEKKVDGQSFFELDRSFRELQAKEGVIEIAPSIKESI